MQSVIQIIMARARVAMRRNSTFVSGNLEKTVWELQNSILIINQVKSHTRIQLSQNRMKDKLKWLKQ